MHVASPRITRAETIIVNAVSFAHLFCLHVACYPTLLGRRNSVWYGMVRLLGLDCDVHVHIQSKCQLTHLLERLCSASANFVLATPSRQLAQDGNHEGDKFIKIRTFVAIKDL
jgi:hypothetical protein